MSSKQKVIIFESLTYGLPFLLLVESDNITRWVWWALMSIWYGFVIGASLGVWPSSIEVRKIKRWADIFNLPLNTYPKNLAERELLRGWMTDQLADAAKKATIVFSRRDQRPRGSSLEEWAGSGSIGPYKLPEVREKFLSANRRQKEELRSAVELANFRQEAFLKMWDFLKGIDTVPINNATGEPWSNPNDFRLSLEKPVQ